MARKLHSKTYVVFEGRHPGVYDSWPECQAQINGYSGCVYRSYPSVEEANAAWLQYQDSSSSEKYFHPTQSYPMNQSHSPFVETCHQPFYKVTPSQPAPGLVVHSSTQSKNVPCTHFNGVLRSTFILVAAATFGALLALAVIFVLYD